VYAKKTEFRKIIAYTHVFCIIYHGREVIIIVSLFNIGLVLQDFQKTTIEKQTSEFVRQSYHQLSNKLLFLYNIHFVCESYRIFILFVKANWFLAFLLTLLQFP